MLERGAILGILGDGQLGRMIAQAAQRKGFKVHGFGQDPHGPLAQVTPYFTQAAFNDAQALQAFADGCQVVTSEFENVPLAALQTTACRPQASIFALAQDRLAEKTAARDAGLETAPFFGVESLSDLRAALQSLGGRGILKTRRFGYDGKGQWRLDGQTDLEAIWNETPRQDLILEGWVDFAFETSVLVARNAAGQVVQFPCGQNVHHDGILYQTIVPGRIDAALQTRAQAAAEGLATHLGLVGLLAIELFVQPDGTLIFNEMAPRPHNSGHWTMEGCDRSQFDVLVDVLTGAPLVQPVQLAPATMTNLLGDKILSPQTAPKTYWHDYGKAEPKTGRKMGHVTVLD